MSKEQARYTYVYRVTSDGRVENLRPNTFDLPSPRAPFFGSRAAARVYESSTGSYWVVLVHGEPYQMPDLDSAIASAVMKVSAG